MKDEEEVEEEGRTVAIKEEEITLGELRSIV